MMEAYGNAHAPRWYPGVAQLSYGQRMVLYRVYSDRQSQLHMDLEVYMREYDDHRGLQRLKLAAMAMELVLGMAILPCDQREGFS